MNQIQLAKEQQQGLNCVLLIQNMESGQQVNECTNQDIHRQPLVLKEQCV